MEIVGLKQALPDHVNNIVAKFVGTKPLRYMNFDFIGEIYDLNIDYIYDYLWSIKVDEDYVFENYKYHKLFHESVLLSCRNCRRCHKNKRKRGSYCFTCYRIENPHLDGCYCAGHFIDGGCMYCRDVGAGESPVNSDSD